MKKNITILSVFLVGFSLNIQAQADIALPGLVVRQNSKQKTGQIEYLSNASVKSTQATPTRTDANGQFTLVFADKPAYNVTRIFVEKSGMEVVNKTDLERAAVLGRLDRLKVVMCSAGELMENQMLYYGIAEKHIVGRFKKRIAALETANTGVDKMIAEINEEFNLELKTKNEAIYALEKEWSKALTSAQETAEKFAAINIDDADPLYLQADAAYKKGDFDNVLQLLQLSRLEKNIRNIQSNLSAADSLSKEGQARIARGTENLRQTIENALFGARVAKLNGAWKKAEAYYDLAVKGDEYNYDVTFEAAYYMQSQNQFSKARTYYETALTQISQPFEKGNILNNLGVLLSDNDDIFEAKKAYEEALQIARQLAMTNPEVYLLDVVKSLNNLGALLTKNNEIGEAKKAYEEALKASRQLAKNKSDLYLRHEAMSLNNLGTLLAGNNEMDEAKKAYNEALLIRKQLAEKNPDAYLPDVAGTLNNLGLLLSNNDEMVGAKKDYEEALQIYRRLAEKNPDVYLPYVALTLNNLGILLSDKNEIDEAKKAYGEALLIRRQLAEKNPNVYLPYMAMTLNNLGTLLKTNNELAGAKKAYDEALQIIRQLSEKNPGVYLPYVAGTLNNLGLLLKDSKQMVEAKKAYKEALQIRRQLARQNPNAYQPDVAMTLINLGALFHANKEMVAAKEAYEEALQIYRQLVEKKTDAWLPDMALTLNNLGVLLKDNKQMVEAKKAYEEALQIRRQLADKNPDAYRPDVAMTLVNLGVLFYVSKEMVTAKEAYEEALQIYKQLSEKKPDVYLPNMAKTLNSFGNLLFDNNEVAEAKKACEEALEIYQQLAEKNPETYNLEVATTGLNIGLFYEHLLKTTGDMTLKSSGLELMQEAAQRLAIYPETHPSVQLFKPFIQQLIRFFKDFDEAAFQLQKKYDHLSVLESANKTEKDPYEKVRRQKEMLDLLSEMENASPGNNKVVNLIASKYGSLAWYQLFVRQFAEAEQSARAGLAKDPTQEWINTNLVLALLYQGKWEATKQIYESLKGKPYGDNRTYKATFLEDLDALEEEGITHPDVSKARQLLEKQ